MRSGRPVVETVGPSMPYNLSPHTKEGGHNSKSNVVFEPQADRSKDNGIDQGADGHIDIEHPPPQGSLGKCAAHQELAVAATERDIEIRLSDKARFSCRVRAGTRDYATMRRPENPGPR